jgi:hypothetical protein
MSRRTITYGAAVVGILAGAVPLTFVTTFALVPFWSWVERTYGIEAIGHSGPSEWCFWLIYGLTVGTATLIFVLRRRRADGGKATSGS